MLYVIRHGITDWNEELKMQGRTDIPLNEKGREMARAAAMEYKDVHFDICFASPLCRAYETAQIVLDGREIEIIKDDRLKEICFGVYEGQVYSSHDPESPLYTFFKKPEMYTGVEGGETFEELFKRTGEFLKEEVEPRLEKGMDILIAGHGAMNSSIVCQKKGIPLSRFWEAGIPNCKLMEI